MLIKILLTLFTILNINTVFAYEPSLLKGSFIKVYTKIPLTTENLETGSRVYFIAPADVWVVETKMIEEGDIFLGHVDMLKMPIQGINAAMSVKITSLVKKNGEKYPLEGRLIFSGSEVLGGNLTNPASYNTTIHPRRVYGNHWGGTLQYVPSGEYEFGSHVGVTSKDSLFVRLDEEFSY